MKHSLLLSTASLCLLCLPLIHASSASDSPRKFARRASQASQLAVPRFEQAECPIVIPDSEKDSVRCGYLVARENRTRKNDRTIRLPVIILKSSSKNPAPDPVLRTFGGPGVSSLRMVRSRRSSPWLNDRDMVIFEQRGTRYAEPKLDCPEVQAARRDSLVSGLTGRTAIGREVLAAKKCYDRLIEEGIDLSAYDSVQSAADIEDLRQVLGYSQWNLYGLSYSSRLMLNVMRDHPRGVRSVVLESVLPPSVNYDEAGVDGAMRSLSLFFANCAADSECAKAYPNLGETFYDLVRRTNEVQIKLETKPANSEQPIKINLSGHDLTTWLLDYVLSTDPETILSGPSQIYKIVKGEYGPLKNYVADKAAPGGYMWGMRYSVWCREELPFENRKRIAAQSQRYPQLPGYKIQPALLAVCDVWKVERAPLKENQPVKSRIPTLVLAAEYDAYTPPAWGRLAAKTLRRSFFYEVPGVGHGPAFTSVCAQNMIAEFFDNPLKAPNAACLRVPRRKFAASPT